MSIKALFELLGVHIPENPDTLQIIKVLRDSRQALRSRLSQFPDRSADDFDRETEIAFEVFDHVERLILQGAKVPPMMALFMAGGIRDYFGIVGSRAPQLGSALSEVASLHK